MPGQAFLISFVMSTTDKNFLCLAFARSTENNVAKANELNDQYKLGKWLPIIDWNQKKLTKNSLTNKLFLSL